MPHDFDKLWFNLHKALHEEHCVCVRCLTIQAYWAHCNELRDELSLVGERLKNHGLEFKSIALNKIPESYLGEKKTDLLRQKL